MDNFRMDKLRVPPTETTEKRFWIDTYLIALRGLFDNDRWNGTESLHAKRIADKSLELLRETFKPITISGDLDESTTNGLD